MCVLDAVYSSDATSMSDFSDKMSFWLLYAFFSMGLLAIRMNQDGFRSFCSTHGSLLPIEFANIICSWMVWCMQVHPFVCILGIQNAVWKHHGSAMTVLCLPVD